MKKNTTSTSAFPKAEIGREVKSDCVVECLIARAWIVFAYPGGASELHQSLARTDKIRVILPRHEQGGSFAAEAMPAPPASRRVYNNQRSRRHQPRVGHRRRVRQLHRSSRSPVRCFGTSEMAFQETNYGMTLPIVKHRTSRWTCDLPRIFKAFHLANTAGRDR